MLLGTLVDASKRVASTRKRLEKAAILAQCLLDAGPQRPLVARYLSGELRQRKIGVGGAQVHALRDVPPASEPALAISDVDGAFEAIANEKGTGSAGRRT